MDNIYIDNKNNNNSKDQLFKQIFNNSVLNTQIFKNVEDIHSNNLHTKSHNWLEVNQNLLLLTKYQYQNEILEYFNNIQKNRFFETHSIMDNIQIVLESYIEIDRLDLFKEFVSKMSVLFQEFEFDHSHLEPYRLLKVATNNQRINFIEYFFEIFHFSLEQDEDTSYIEEILESVANISPSQISLSILELLFKKFKLVEGEVYTLIVTRSIELDRLDIFKWLESNVPGFNLVHYINQVGYHNSQSFNTIKYLHSTGRLDPEKFTKLLSFSKLIESNHEDLLTWIVDNEIKKPSGIKIHSKISLKLLQFLHGKGININFVYPERVVETCSLEVIQWIHQQQFKKKSMEKQSIDFNWKKMIDFAAFYNKLDIVIWLNENNSSFEETEDRICTPQALEWAGKNGNLDILKWLYQNRLDIQNIGFNFSETTLKHAIENGQVQVVEWLKEIKPDLKPSSISLTNIIKNNQLEMASWVLGNSKVSNNDIEDALLVLIRNKNLDFLKFIFLYLDIKTLENISQFIYKLCYQCIHMNSVEIFNFIHSNYAHNMTEMEIEKIMNFAAGSHCLEIIRKLEEHHPKVPSNQLPLMFTSKFGGINTIVSVNLEMLQYYLSTRDDLEIDNNFLISCIESNRINIAAWLLENHHHRFNFQTLSEYKFQHLDPSIFKNHSQVTKKFRQMVFKKNK